MPSDRTFVVAQFHLRQDLLARERSAHRPALVVRHCQDAISGRRDMRSQPRWEALTSTGLIKKSAIDLLAGAVWPQDKIKEEPDELDEEDDNAGLRLRRCRPRLHRERRLFSAITRWRRAAGNITPTILDPCGYSARRPSLVPILYRSQV